MKQPRHTDITLNNIDEIDIDIDIESVELGAESGMCKPYDPTQIRVDPKSFSLRNVLDMIDDEDLDLAPDFQRMRVWTPEQKSRLIESILLRIPLPAFYFSSDADGYMQVVDGVQRLSTIHEFVRNNSFILQHLEYLDKELGGKSFSDIKGTIWAKRIYTTQIVVNVIDPQTPTRVKFDIFKRINTGGTPLKAQEIRHCMSGKRSRELLKRLTALKSFADATGGRLSGHLRMADRELALRWVAFTIIDELNDYGGDDIATLEDLLNVTTERIDSDGSIDVNFLFNQFDHAMTLAKELFGLHTFRKWMLNEDYRYPLNKALFESLSVPLARVETSKLAGKKKQIQHAFRQLCSEDEFFISSISTGTGDPKKVRYRFEKIDKIIKAALL
ncbi:MAG: GmrSD restriction endonuclease domain-containing protein [Burkholderiales bacterium]